MSRWQPFPMPDFNDSWRENGDNSVCLSNVNMSP
jgi:hypothetical protein